MILNSNNIEDLVLKNSSVVNSLSHFRNLIDQWKLGQMIPALRPTGQKAKIDLLNKLTNEDIEIIKKINNLNHLTLEKLDYSSISFNTTNIFEADKLLNNGETMLGDFCINRDGDQLYICTWR
jgi:hypothetical protein